MQQWSRWWQLKANHNEDHDYAQQDQHNHDQCTRTPSQPRLKPKDPISTKNNAMMIPIKGQWQPQGT